MKPRLFVPILLLASALAACTIYVQPGTVSGRVSIGVSLSDIIVRFEPTKGSGATYAVGEPVVFTIFPRESGYVTLSAIDPDGRIYTFARNMRVDGGRSNVLPTPSDRFVFIADHPTGFHRIRASFTSGRTDVNRVTYVGRRGEEEWNNTITVDFGNQRIRDVAQTFLNIF